MRLYDEPTKKKVYYTNIESDFNYAKLTYESILKDNPGIDDETAIEYLTTKLSETNQSIVEDYYMHEKELERERTKYHELAKK